MSLASAAFAVLVVWLSLVVAACSFAPRGGVPTFVDPSNDRLAAALEGELAIRDDCLVLLTGTRSFAIAWHSSTASWIPDENAIQIANVRAEVGDRVALGGGEMSVRADNLGDWRWAVAPSDDCLRQDGFWFTWGLEHLQASLAAVSAWPRAVRGR